MHPDVFVLAKSFQNQIESVVGASSLGINSPILCAVQYAGTRSFGWVRVMVCLDEDANIARSCEKCQCPKRATRHPAPHSSLGFSHHLRYLVRRGRVQPRLNAFRFSCISCNNGIVSVLYGL